MDDGSDLSQRILRAARQLFFAHGYVDTSLRAIAAEAGTSESGIFRIYRSKGGLLRAVYASLWAEVNARIDEAMSQAARRDPSAENLLLELTRVTLEYYQAEPAKMEFIMSHFGSYETAGLGPPRDVDPKVDVELRYEYHRYLRRINDLCDALVNERPQLGATGISSSTLGHFAISVIHGIQTSWFMADQEWEAAETKVTIEEVLGAMKFFLYTSGVKQFKDGGH
ncbi:MAG: TetR/AcrR family transcriptional regulator [Thermoleophilia bacterium]|nr:TetR/AcrR family transcriptional regulator [Thermoleophilia bacterium]